MSIMHTRRKFLRECSLAAVAVTLAPAALAHCPAWEIKSAKGPWLPEFRQELNSWFMVGTGSKIFPLQLVEVNDFLPALPLPESGSKEKFSLRFRSLAAVSLAQHTYVFHHSRLGSISIFIVPGSSRDGYNFYTAIFDRVTNQAELGRLVSMAPGRAKIS